MKHFLFILLFSKLIACNNGSDTNSYSGNSRSSDSGKIVIPGKDSSIQSNQTGCYMKIVGHDTAILMLEENGKEYSGKMIYDNYEKDGSRGVIKGKEEAGVLKLWYDFDSEGTHSVSQVYFKKDNGKLLRGVGDMDTKTDTAFFISGINYSDKEAFVKVYCGLISWKLKF
jgi:hypothetical protein